MKTTSYVSIVAGILVVAGLIWFFYPTAVVTPAGSPTSGITTNTSTTTTTTTTFTNEVPGANLTLGQNATSALGNYLVAYNGMTLYTDAPDGSNVSNCTGVCAANWPPYTVTSTANLVAESPIRGKISTLKRANGSTQVTYNGHPLYFYVRDSKSGDTLGQGIGGIWYIVKP